MTTNETKRILIADDEPLARQRIQRLLEAQPGYQVCGEAADGHDALRKVAELEPDIVLLDIRMPGMDGMDAAAQLSQLHSPPALIFCTAYDHYAIQAFEVRAAAYLLKPVRREALVDALARAGKVNRLQSQALAQANGGSREQLAVRTHRGTELIDLANLYYCEADQKYVTLHHTGGETVCDYTLKELEQAYPDHLLRIHRHTLVGVGFIQGLRRSTDGQNQLALRGRSDVLQVSRRHATSVRQWLREHQPSP
ncbi:LytTR family DNA-binding domain-containing protein [Marinobacter daepoensis]|uniref:Response regulator transcription factor n=1 Tax=Marinobacter daepoensis TaxID=262077 RepID=A0ABS3BCH8_9GAMM|nr:LytTR family DNA-binding domain-containing protein [Marinobacter daepoensis]MBN7768561.1 response regulator transcription factor [Marinobacter daepoensis]MBY6032985.1 LytTR family DNA-binding domain-containing protein [Marinobacter daepoensis]MBY6079298.1 LytTR family DNA-binding domain-containing protein [Marinobacter daepoensis]